MLVPPNLPKMLAALIAFAPISGQACMHMHTVDRQRLAALSVWRRLTFEHGLFGQFVIMNREIVEQDGRMAARHFYCQFAHLGRTDAPMFQIEIACGGRGHWDYSPSLSVMYLNTHCSHVELCKTAHFRFPRHCPVHLKYPHEKLSFGLVH